MRLTHTTVLVTGGASGIGAAIGQRFSAEGASVVIADIDATSGAAVATEVGGSFVKCDVRIEEDIAGAVQHTVDRFGRLNCFIANAGVRGSMSSVVEIDARAFDEDVAVLLRSVVLGMKHAVAAMQRDGGGGSIISTASVAGVQGGLGNHVYTACKAGIIGLTRSVACEQARHGIRVNCICPGLVATPMWRAPNAEELAGTAVEEFFARAISSRVPLGRFAAAEEIAAAAAYLASPDAGYVTGQALVVDGGLTAISNFWDTKSVRAERRERASRRQSQ